MCRYNRYQTDIMFITVVLLIVIVQVFQVSATGPLSEATGAFPDLFRDKRLLGPTPAAVNL